jgi:hypothetical protein
MKKTVFVLGAGFSAAGGFPLVRGLRTRVLSSIQLERHPSYSAWIKPGQGFTDGQFYDGLVKVDPAGTLGFEELLIELRRRLKHVSKWDSQHITDLVLRIGCARLLWQSHRLINTLVPCYLNFARRTFKLSEGRQHVVVSFNWDVLFERSLQDEGVSWFYSFRSGCVPVLKPHGSINWNSHLMSGNRSDYFYWQGISKNSEISVDVSGLLRDPDPDEMNPEFRYMLFPGDPELPEQNASLRQLWSDVEMALRNCERVVFIGYSLPEYDSYAAETFRRFTAGKEIEVYNPSADQLGRFRDLLGDQVKLFPLKFEHSPFAQAV